MSIGSTEILVVCAPVPAASTEQQSLCPAREGQAYTPANMQAYVLDPALQKNLEAALGPFDYAYASGAWALGFSTIVGLYIISLGIGSVLGMIRRG